MTTRDIDPAVLNARDALHEARLQLAEVLDQLAAEAKSAAKHARSAKATVDLPAVYNLVTRVQRAEEDVDFATTDLASSSGEGV